MKAEDLVRDPVFQLNLLLWMAKEQPAASYRVRPLFHELGFEIIYIEQPFRFPEETARAAEASGLDISRGPEPDLILGRRTDNRALYFEAKADSFGVLSPNSRQARGHLLASGPAFGEVLAPLTDCLLCYVVPETARTPMRDCLTALSEELNTKGLKPGGFSCHGLGVSETQLVYSWDVAFRTHAGLDQDAVPVLRDLTEDCDPTPLVLVFTDEDCPNQDLRHFYRRVLIDQVRACLLCDLHPLPIGERFGTTPDDLLTKTTDGIFQYLGRSRQGRLRRLIHENLFKQIVEHWQDKLPGVTLGAGRLEIVWSAPGEKEEFLDWLKDRRTTFDAKRPPREQPSLFDHPDQPGSEEA